MNRKASVGAALTALLFAGGLLAAVGPPAKKGPPEAAAPLIGYSELRTNLPGGHHGNVRTTRAVVVGADGSGRRVVAAELAREAGAWTQFAGWSPDGKTAIIGRGWVSAENAAWEEKHRQFRYTAKGWLCDSYLVDLATGKATNVTAVERVSFHNSGLFYWPNDPTKLGFVALIEGNSHPFRMDRDGRNKVDLTKGSREFAYGFNTSPDGKRIAYNKTYQVYLANADGSKAVHVKTGKPFNFVPRFSPDGQWVLFLSGEHYDCHPHLVRADGTGLKKLADRGGYRGVVEFLDVFDFHGGSSDTPVWSIDGKSVFYTAKVDKSVELFQVSLDGKATRLTKSPAGTLHYHPQPSPDGKWLAYGSKRAGVRQLYVMRSGDRTEKRITNLKVGHAAMWPYWQPTAGAADKKLTPDEVLAGVKRFFEKTARPDGSFRPGIDADYRGMSDSAYSDLAPVAYAVVLSRTFGWKLPHEEKTKQFLLGRQRKSGEFVNVAGTVDPASPAGHAYNTTMALMALRAMGVKPKYDPLPVFAAVLKEDYRKLPLYMTSFFPLAYLCAGKEIPPEADRKIKALMVQDEDGYIHDHVASTFHAAHYYRLIGEKTPKADKMLARVLRDQKADGSWMLNMPSRDRHATFDAAFVIRQLGKGADCQKALDRAAAWAMSCRNDDGGFGHFPGSPSDADAVYFQVGTLVMAGWLPPVKPVPKDARLLGWGHLFPVP